ncbi:MAG: 4Fe-4S dicluster domain-containing protein [Proteobacteria bacterium]|nr:4Fe-4S dicluster domain-containing protein [Pseudomonadota bacterium]
MEKKAKFEKKINADGVGLKSTRRDFIKQVTLGGGATFVFGNLGLLHTSCSATQKNGKTNYVYSSIIVDYRKCTGCRTCETVCSAHNNKVEVNGKLLPGFGNPHFSNIKVLSYNPDVDIPAVCALCSDAPCIDACPVDPDPKTGHRALYRDDETGTIKNDAKRCIGCGTCEDTCKSKRVGIITMNPKTNKPGGICTLCNGSPKCVDYCPFDALSFAKRSLEDEFHGKSPDIVAKKLSKSWYAI